MPRPTALKRIILEMGMGNDLHGSDYTKAALRAVQDAIFKVLQDFTAIGNAVQVISEEGDSEEWEKVSLDCRWLAQEISHRYVQHRIAVDFNEVITPSWLRAAQ